MDVNDLLRGMENHRNVAPQNVQIDKDWISLYYE